MALKSTIASFILFFGFFTTLYGQEWQQYYKSAQDFLANGEVEKANDEALKCLANYQQSQGAANTVYASILRLLQNSSYGIGDFEKGLDYARKEITIRESTPDTLLAGAFQQAAQFYQQLGQFQKALDVLNKSREILRQYFKETEPEVVECNLLLGINYYLNDDEGKAFNLLNESLKQINPSLAEESALGLLYLGIINLDREKTAEGAKILNQAQELYTSLGMNESLENGLIFFNLGEALHHMKKFDQAEKYYVEAQNLMEKLEATDSDIYLKILNQRSVNLQALGNSLLAKELLNKIKNQPGGELAYAESLSNRATILQNQNAFDKSLELYKEALSLFDKASKEGLVGYATTLENLAILYSELDEKEKSIKSITEAITYLDKVFGTNHQRLISAYSKKGSILLRYFDYPQAKQDFERAWSILSNSPNPTQKEKVAVLGGMARCWQVTGEFKKADSLYGTVLALYASNEINDPNYLNALNSLASSQQDQGNWSAARQLIIKVKNIVAKDPEISESLLANALENCALINLRLGFTAEAKEQLDSALLIVERGGKQSIEYGLISLTLGKYYQTVGDYTIVVNLRMSGVFCSEYFYQ